MEQNSLYFAVAFLWNSREISYNNSNDNNLLEFLSDLQYAKLLEI